MKSWEIYTAGSTYSSTSVLRYKENCILAKIPDTEGTGRAKNYEEMVLDKDTPKMTDGCSSFAKCRSETANVDI